MVVGVIGWEIQLFDARSLKEKRRVVKSLKERLRNRFNVSVAETGHQDTWQRAEITACIVTTDRRRADSVLDRMDRLVESSGAGRIIDSQRTYY
ncbi:MAG: DUF503 family protein [Gammaproteobacteria bacterium]|nr:DUF503 domain-containing protein [Gemmatimonadota bacterium]NIU76356.1 DUF503 family protein [Gammaproteobacteria bacterium]NIW38906.1 DUF503 family protein [Gemmatimonadota bacterium]NIY10142.1 DUF503 family protein [Gemmatimonadota bacterium]